MTVLLDSFCWFEYFQGTSAGEKVRAMLSSGDEILVSPVTVFEVRRKYLQKLPEEAKSKTDFITSRALLVPLDEAVASLAADLSVKHSLHATDALIYAAAVRSGCILITGDPHFRGLPGVKLI